MIDSSMLHVLNQHVRSLSLRPLFSAFLLLICVSAFSADEASQKDERFPFRTETANAHLPWYTPKPLEFPPLGSECRISGELVTIDFYHRKGQFRTSDGERHDFNMPPYGCAWYLNSEADLHDLPLGTRFMFFLHQDKDGKFTRLATLKDQFTLDANDGVSYRLDEIGENKLVVTKQNASKSQSESARQELLVTKQTGIWKGAKEAQLGDLAVGDVLLFNAAIQGPCTEIWAGAEAQKNATEAQSKKFRQFLKFRGVPGWIEKTEGLKMTVVLFSCDPEMFKKIWAGDFVANRDIAVCVANDELRTWNPPVDREGGKVNEVLPAPKDVFGCSGVRLVVSVNHMLEGFRRGLIVRLFGPGWHVADMPFGEGIYSEMQTAEINVITPKEFPGQFPFRTDYGNDHLSWYTLKAGESPPRYSEHIVYGELLSIDPAKGSGKMRVESSAETVDFTFVSQGARVAVNTNKVDDRGPARWNDSQNQAMYLNGSTSLDQLPLGIRYRFNMYQDEKGAFTKTTLLTDEFTYLALNKLVYRVVSINLENEKLRVARQLPQRRNHNGDMIQPNDIGCAELRVNSETRLWKGETAAKLNELAVSDLLLVNITAEQTGKPSICTDIWVGPDTHTKATEQQRKKQPKSDAKKP